MEKKSSTKEVHKLVQQDYPELYKKLCNILGSVNPFAQFRIGAGIFIWSDTRCDWQPMTASNSATQKRIKEALFGVRQTVSAKLGEKQTELLFTIPDDGYIYYNEDDGEVKVLITGWGFKKPVRLSPTPPAPEPINVKDASIAFVYDGERIPNYTFGLSLMTQKRRLHTDENGVCNVGNLCTGKQYLIYDIQNNNKEYHICIVPEQSYYEIDITRYATLHVSAVLDGQPLAHETVMVQYNGSTYDSLTGDDGNTSIKIPFHEGVSLSASLRDKKEDIVIKEDDNYIDFILVSPPPVVETDVVVMVMLDSNICPNKQVSIEYCGETYYGATDDNGQFTQHLQVSHGEPCVVSVEEYASQQKELTDSPTHVFRFEKTTPLPERPVRITPTVIVQRANGDVVADYPITIETSDYTKGYVTDTNGKVILPDIIENEVMTIIDGHDDSHRETHTILKDQEHYIFTIPDEEPVPVPQLKLMFRDKDGKPIECDAVLFRQEGIDDITFSLDENGDVYLPSDTFATGKEITATINGWKDNYAPIPFATEEDEYEYLLQEKDSDRSWLNIILQILTILAATIVAIVLWPYIEAFFAGAYEGIYGVDCPYFL